MKAFRRIVSVFLACLLVCSLCLSVIAADTQSGSMLLTTDVPATVTFDANGGSGTMEAVSVTVGTEYTLPRCSFTAPGGKAFQCWKIGDETYVPGRKIMVSSHVTVQAVWRNSSPAESAVRQLVQLVFRIIRNLFRY